MWNPFGGISRRQVQSTDAGATGLAHRPGAKTARWSMAHLAQRPERMLSLLLLVFFLGGWELAVWAFNVPRIVVPAPSAVFASLVSGLATGRLWYNCWITFFETMAGFALGAAVGFVLGGVIGQFRLSELTLY